MTYSEKWKIIENCGEGGQGKVSRVIRIKELAEIEEKIGHAMRDLSSSVISVSRNRRAWDDIQKWLPKMLDITKPMNQFALKVLHELKDARDPKLAKERIHREIIAMSKNQHPNLIKLEDFDPDDKWFVSKFYAGGTLAQKQNEFKGDFLLALKTIRPLVEGVAELHKTGYVHRDIKPQNIFIGAQNEIVLGDFGLIYFDDAKHSRISETYENVGTRDWMPAWAIGMRIDEIKPTFDVFSLGKVLWAMTSGKPVLRLWYFDHDQFNVESMFSQDKNIKWANPLFKKCIVEYEHNCLPNAGALLEEIDKTIVAIESDADRIVLTTKRRCKICGLGEYDLIADENHTDIINFGIRPTGMRTMKIFTCNNCGNVQLFSYEEKLPPAWLDLKNKEQNIIR